MKTIVVDDEPIMLQSFRRLSSGIDSIRLVGEFQYPEEALEYAESNVVELAILDISMPGMTGIELAEKLREQYPEILIVFITAYDEYLRDSNLLGADDYILKPYRRDTIEKMAARMSLLSRRLQKNIYVQTFGNFLVYKNGKPVPLKGKAKEILALVVTRRGKEISNKGIYSTLWEDRTYSNINMKVYYNALKRLRNTLSEYDIKDLLISTARGQTVNTEMFDCDYYSWQDNDAGERDRFQGQFMNEYSWGEYILADIMYEGW